MQRENAGVWYLPRYWCSDLYVCKALYRAIFCVTSLHVVPALVRRLKLMAVLIWNLLPEAMFHSEGEALSTCFRTHPPTGRPAARCERGIQAHWMIKKLPGRQDRSWSVVAT